MNAESSVSTNVKRSPPLFSASPCLSPFFLAQLALVLGKKNCGTDMSRYDSRSTDPGSYRDRRSDGGFGGGTSAPNFGSSRAAGFDGVRSSSSSRKDSENFGASLQKQDFDDLIPFDKNFYVESPSVASMSEEEVEAYRRRRQITVEGKDVPKPVKDFRDVGFPGEASWNLRLC
ncbi:hypothetical protein ACLOJK_039947 [Asimina triloba]